MKTIREHGQLDRLSLFGAFLALAAIFFGNYLEGGSFTTLINLPAAIIVIGGTLGAALLQTPVDRIGHAFAVMRWVFYPPTASIKDGINQVSNWGKIAHQKGLIGLEDLANKEKDQFAKLGLQMLADGHDPQRIRVYLETELIGFENAHSDAAKFYACMGGYAPTVGIIGAILGLIHVMDNLADPAELGSGIATAFVATIYGVGLANLLLLPIANKIQSTINKISLYKEMILHGIIYIADGESPANIKQKLQAYLETPLA